MRRLVLRQRYFTGICSIAVVTPASFQRSVMGLKKRGKQIKRQMRRLELRQRYFTDICSIAVVTSALFQRSVMDLKKRGKQIETRQLAIQHNSKRSARLSLQSSELAPPAPSPTSECCPPFGTGRLERKPGNLGIQ
jgi:hypothetical protein